MGINLSLKRIVDDDWETVSDEFSFDSIRYVGDREFWSYLVHFGECASDHNYPPESCFRPISFQEARDWVKENLAQSPGNQPRLFNLIDILEQNSDVWLYAG